MERDGIKRRASPRDLVPCWQMRRRFCHGHAV